MVEATKLARCNGRRWDGDDQTVQAYKKRLGAKEKDRGRRDARGVGTTFVANNEQGKVH